MGPGVKIDPSQFMGQNGGSLDDERAAKTDADRRDPQRGSTRCTAAVFVDYKGMTVEAATKLRVEFRKAGVEYKVCKNTLVKQALKNESFADQLVTGPRGHDGDCVELRGPERGAPRS